MSGKFIATIYFYVISAASLALIVIGIFNAVNFGINISQYDKYPLRYPQADCDNMIYPYGSRPILMETDKISTPSAKDLEKQKKICIKQQDEDRKQHRVDDLKNALTFTLVGLVLFTIHFPLARKQSKG